MSVHKNVHNQLVNDVKKKSTAGAHIHTALNMGSLLGNMIGTVTSQSPTKGNGTTAAVGTTHGAPLPSVLEGAAAQDSHGAKSHKTVQMTAMRQANMVRPQASNNI